MTIPTRSISLALAFTFAALSATAQTPPASQTTPTPPPAQETRPATTTFLGDTGLWFVPTAEVLARGKWSGTGYRRGTNYIQGY
ncbi:MAG TPA: hypothetical protein VM818_19100, partial [Vicinamibacterales bacterium]|nr:hypothetical protein [Vicinamibacterales bacterium]